MNGVYFDYAAATPLDSKVAAAMQPYWQDRFYNPSAIYLSSKAVSRDIEAARARVAGWLGARPSEIIFTAGGTEANNLAIRGVMQQFPEATCAVSAIEHDSVLKTAQVFDHVLLPVNKAGIVQIDTCRNAITDRTVLVSVMLANNEVGSIQPLKEISQELQNIRKTRKAQGNPLPLYFHTDACQAPNVLDVHADSLGVDMMTLNGGKIYGPKQSGILYVRSGVTLQPLITGGGQEWGMRSGTENVAHIVGFAAALDIAQSMRKTERARLGLIQKQCIAALQACIPLVIVNGSLTERLVNNIHITIPGSDNERLIMELDERGYMCAAGSACSASSDEPSHVLMAMGLSEQDAQSSIRITLGRGTTQAQIDAFVATLADLI